MAGHLEYFRDKNKVRYAYLEANHDRSRLLNKPEKESIVSGPHVKHSLVDLAIGTETFSDQNQVTVSYSGVPVAESGQTIEFDGVPTVIAMAEDENVNLTVDSDANDTFTITASEKFTGKVHWIAIDKVTSAETNIVMIVETGTVSFTGGLYETVEYDDNNKIRFQQASDVYGIEPVVLLSSTVDSSEGGSVNLWLTDPTVKGFTVNTSQHYTGTVYYLAASIRIIGR
jgi:hypothetical protein|tara:strand:- start:2706 stop:3389 length:684 start_codon:yes stop_codon:yes gene_type:complete